MIPYQPSIFHDPSWSTPWQSTDFASDFPPNETIGQRYKRQHARPDWKSTPRFLSFQSGKMGGWPWGWAIYRISYTHTSNEDWARAIEKLDQACLNDLTSSESYWIRRGCTNVGMIREGYRNVIFDDPALEGASVATIRTKHLEWVKSHGLGFCGGAPRLDYCLFLDDRCVRSILASAEPMQLARVQSDLLNVPYKLYKPGAMVGYVNFIDSCFDPEDPENDSGECYQGMVRVHLDCLFKFADECDNLMEGMQEWGDWGMDYPDRHMVYTNGRSSTVLPKGMFLSSPEWEVRRTASVTEDEYIERQGCPYTLFQRSQCLSDRTRCFPH
ncbi:unnamed protein product [Penicillium salamii]|nr:unnamed protein product [Penicillium salamii]